MTRSGHVGLYLGLVFDLVVGQSLCLYLILNLKLLVLTLDLFMTLALTWDFGLVLVSGIVGLDS